jgi:hypothetical protein
MYRVLLLGCWGPIAGFVAGKHYNVLWGRVYLAFYCLKVSYIGNVEPQAHPFDRKLLCVCVLLRILLGTRIVFL